jgi:hypothetical protein
VYYTNITGLKVQKASEKALALLKDPLLLPLRPKQAIQMTPGLFLTGQKKLEVFWTSKKKNADLKNIFH